MCLTCQTLRLAQPKSFGLPDFGFHCAPLGFGLVFGLAALALTLHELALVCMLALAAWVRGPTSRMHTPALALHRLALVCMARKYTPEDAFNRLALVCMHVRHIPHLPCT